MSEPSTLEPTCPPSAPARGAVRRRRDACRGSVPPRSGGRAAACASTSGSTRIRRPRSPTPSVWTLDRRPAAATPVAIAAAVTIAAAPSPHLELDARRCCPIRRCYRLEVVEPPASVAFDPLRTWLPVRLRPDCPDLGSCFAVPAAAAAAAALARARLPRRATGARCGRRSLEFLLRRASRRRRLDRRPDDHRRSSSSRTSATCSTTASTGSRPRLPRDRAAAHLGAAARAARRLRRSARPCRRETFVHVDVAPNALHRDRRRGQRGASTSAPVRPRLHRSRRDLAADARLGEIPIYDWGEDGVLPLGRRDRVRARPSAARRPARRRVAGRRRPDRLRGRRPRRPRRARKLGDAVCSSGRSTPAATRASGTRSRAGWHRSCSLTEVDAVRRPAARSGACRSSGSPGLADDALARPYPVGIDTATGAAEVTVGAGEPRPRPPRAARRRPAGTTLAQRLPDWADPEDAPPSELSLVAAGSPGARPERGRPGPVDRAGRAPDRPEPAPHRLDVSVLLPSGLAVPAARVGTPARRAVPARLRRSSSTPRSRSRRSCASRPAPWARRRRSAASCRAAYEVGGGARRERRRERARPARAEHRRPGAAAELADGRRGDGAQPGRGDRRRRPRRRSTSCGATRPRRSRPTPRRAVLPADYAAAVATRIPLVAARDRAARVGRLVAAGHDGRRPRTSTGTTSRRKRRAAAQDDARRPAHARDGGRRSCPGRRSGC